MAEREPSRKLLKTVSAAHIALFRASRGRIGGGLGKSEFALLTTVGRRTGRHRTTPLLLVPSSIGTLVVGSNGGSDRPPSWLANLASNPVATLETRSGSRAVEGRLLTPQERERLWPEVVGRYPQYARYQQHTARTIPLVLLSDVANRS